MNEIAGSPRGRKEGKEENAEFEAGDHGEEKKEEEDKTQGGASGDVEMAVSLPSHAAVIFNYGVQSSTNGPSQGVVGCTNTLCERHSFAGKTARRNRFVLLVQPCLIPC